MRGKLILFVLSLNCALNAQKDAQLLYEGNDHYFSGRVALAAPRYAKALEANPNNRKANFNLGDALYRNAMDLKNGRVKLPPGQKMTSDSLANMMLDQAAQNFAIVANSVSDKDTLHRAWHNIGNCYLQKREYKQAVEAYKKALRYDPKDEESRYNLAYALKHLPEEQKGGGGGGGQQQQQKQEEKQKSEQKQDQQMDKQQAEQLLKALMDSEKKLQEKRKQKAQDPNRREVDKDW